MASEEHCVKALGRHEAAGIEGDWRIVAEPASDLGERPPLDELGPFRWQPSVAPSWNATLAGGEPAGSEQFEGTPRLVIFYLGFGCLHCVEQLQAFAPQIKDFRDSGIEMIAISTEDTEQLQLGLKNFDEPLAIPTAAEAKVYGVF